MLRLLLKSCHARDANYRLSGAQGGLMSKSEEHTGMLSSRPQYRLIAKSMSGAQAKSGSLAVTGLCLRLC